MQEQQADNQGMQGGTPADSTRDLERKPEKQTRSPGGVDGIVQFTSPRRTVFTKSSICEDLRAPVNTTAFVLNVGHGDHVNHIRRWGLFALGGRPNITALARELPEIGF